MFDADQTYDDKGCHDTTAPQDTVPQRNQTIPPLPDERRNTDQRPGGHTEGPIDTPSDATENDQNAVIDLTGNEPPAEKPSKKRRWCNVDGCNTDSDTSCRTCGYHFCTAHITNCVGCNQPRCIICTCICSVSLSHNEEPSIPETDVDTSNSDNEDGQLPSNTGLIDNTWSPQEYQNTGRSDTIPKSGKLCPVCCKKTREWRCLPTRAV